MIVCLDLCLKIFVSEIMCLSYVNIVLVYDELLLYILHTYMFVFHCSVFFFLSAGRAVFFSRCSSLSAFVGLACKA